MARHYYGIANSEVHWLCVGLFNRFRRSPPPGGGVPLCFVALRTVDNAVSCTLGDHMETALAGLAMDFARASKSAATQAAYASDWQLNLRNGARQGHPAARSHARGDCELYREPSPGWQKAFHAQPQARGDPLSLQV
jgi:hypothetical protein